MALAHLPGRTMPSKTETVILDITAKISSGVLRPGDKLPSGREMREHYGVSQMTVRMAIERLKAAGLVTTTPGAGAFVADRPSGRPTPCITGLPCAHDP